jgi:signal transduction histidine kinase
LGSAERLIFEELGIGLPADDSPTRQSYARYVRRFLRDPILVDRLVAVVATVGVEAEVWLGGGTHGHPLPFALLGPLVTLPIAVRRRWPLQVALLATALDALATGLWGPPEVVSLFVAWAFALYGLAVWTGTREFATGTLFFGVTSAAAIVIGPGPTQGGVVFTLVALLVLMLVRRVVRERELRAGLLEREEGLRAREAVVEERARIARELHDMVAHNVSMIVLQAGAERRALPTEARSTREVLTTIEEVGRQALVEMRRLLGMLRTEEGESALAPQPSLATLELLVDQVREAGLPVEVDIHGQPRPLAGGIELAAYRIIQEALTNSLRHAGDARARVAIRYGGKSLEIEVSDDGRGSADADGLGGGGHGLVGMRERVALYGGTLDVGRRNGGGFTVRAVLPLG